MYQRFSFTPNPNLVNNSISGGIRNGASIVDLANARNQRVGLRNIADIVNGGITSPEQYNQVASKLIELGEVSRGLDVLGTPYDREQDALKRQDDLSQQEFLNQHKLNQLGSLNAHRARSLAQQADQFNRSNALARQRFELAQQAANTPKTPASVQEYNYLRDNNQFDGTYLDYQKLKANDYTTPDAVEEDPFDNLTTAQKNDLKKSEAAISTLKSELDKYADMVENHGYEFAPGQERDALVALRRNIQLQAKELYNLGVLNGPDLALMDSMMFDATPSGPIDVPLSAAQGAIGQFVPGMSPGVRARANAEQLKESFTKLYNDKRSALGLPVDDGPPDPLGLR